MGIFGVVKRLSKNVKMLVRDTIGTAGCGLSSVEAVLIPRHSRVAVRTGLVIDILVGTYAHIASHSGLAVEQSIDIGEGVVDIDYCGELAVALINKSDDELSV